jgi:hypothetical protein
VLKQAGVSKEDLEGKMWSIFTVSYNARSSDPLGEPKSPKGKQLGVWIRQPMKMDATREARITESVDGCHLLGSESISTYVLADFLFTLGCFERRLESKDFHPLSGDEASKHAVICASGPIRNFDIRLCAD